MARRHCPAVLRRRFQECASGLFDALALAEAFEPSWRDCLLAVAAAEEGAGDGCVRVGVPAQGDRPADALLVVINRDQRV
jgi:hypothetical protein